MITYECTNGVAAITLSRPEKYNALTAEMLAALNAAVTRAAEDEEARVLVLTGSGRAFSTGQDLNLLPQHGAEVHRILEENYNPVVTGLLDHPKVTVAALNGMALGASLSLALACDIVVAAEGASLCQPFVRIGLLPDAGATWLLPRLVGLSRALALALTADTITAREAQAMGLVYRVFPDDAFASEVAGFAQGLAEKSPLACRFIKQSLRASLANSLPQQLALEAELQGIAVESEASRVAVRAFLDRRRG